MADLLEVNAGEDRAGVAQEAEREGRCDERTIRQSRGLARLLRELTLDSVASVLFDDLLDALIDARVCRDDSLVRHPVDLGEDAVECGRAAHAVRGKAGQYRTMAPCVS